MSRKIAVEIVGDASPVNRAFASASRSANVFEKDLGRSTRGALAGSGVFRGLGRSLAFASGSFLAVSGVTAAISDSIKGAEALAKSQEGLAVAIEHTGGNLKKLIPQYTAVAKGAAEFGVNQADATTALERATVLTGNAAKAQRAYQEALVISKATGKDFNAVLTATSKGQEGITTSLQRYGIQIAKGTKGTEQFAVVMSRFGGQAKANTDSADRFRAVLANTEETIGTALLPTLDKYLNELSNWLEKMQRSGQLQKDLNAVITVTGDVFKTLGSIIGTVDKVTGSFKTTLELLLAAFTVSKITTFGGALVGLAAKWGIVGSAATAAGVAETAAVGEGAVAGAAGGAAIAGGAAGAAGITAGALVAPLAIVGGGAFLLSQSKSKSWRLPNGGLLTEDSTGQFYLSRGGRALGISRQEAGKLIAMAKMAAGPAAVTAPATLPTPGLSRFGGPVAGASTPGGGSSGVFKSFALTLPEQITQARADLTKSTADDVAAAKQVIARVKRLMDEGKLSGKSLLSALQAEGAAMNTLQSAQAAAAQKAAAAAQAQIQNMIDPIRLETQLSKAEALGKPTVAILRALKASAAKALASGKLSLQQQKAAWDQIAQINQAISQAATTATKTFTAPARLQLALAKDSALGLDQTKDLLKLKAAILKFIRTHKGNIAALTDAYNQLAQVNQQLGATANALGGFKQLNTAAIARKVPGLTAAQRKALRAALSQRGPGGTGPGDGVGAYGQVIGTSGRPKRAKPPKMGRPPASGLGGQTGSYVIHDDQPITIYLDGKVIARSTTKHQQKRSRRNPTQRRGANAGGG